MYTMYTSCNVRPDSALSSVQMYRVPKYNDILSGIRVADPASIIGDGELRVNGCIIAYITRSSGYRLPLKLPIVALISSYIYIVFNKAPGVYGDDTLTLEYESFNISGIYSDVDWFIGLDLGVFEPLYWEHMTHSDAILHVNGRPCLMISSGSIFTYTYTPLRYDLMVKL